MCFVMNSIIQTESGSRTKLISVANVIYCYLIAYTLTQIQTAGHVLHLVHNTTSQTTNSESVQAIQIPYGSSINKREGDETITRSFGRRKNNSTTTPTTATTPTTTTTTTTTPTTVTTTTAATIHSPFVSHWYSPDYGRGTTTSRAASTPSVRRLIDMNKRKQPRNRKTTTRRNRGEIMSGPMKTHSSIGSWWSSGHPRTEIVPTNETPFVINSSDMHPSIATLGLIDPLRIGTDSISSAALPTIQFAHLNEDELNSGGSWCTRNLDKDKEISRFVIYLLGRYTVSINPLQIYSIVHEWERYQQQRQLVLQRQWMQVIRQQKRRQRRLEEYNRHLRQFASVITQQHLNQLRKARTFREFKEIMLDQNTITAAAIGTDEVDQSVSSPEDPESRSLVESPLQYPVSGQTIVAAASSALEFPGGAGGGIVVTSLRSTRKGSTRESRAIMEPPISDSTEPLVNVNVKSNQISPTKPMNKQTNGSAIGAPHGSKESGFSEVELRNAFDSYQEFRRNACRPRNQTLCVRSLLGLQQEHTTVVIPSGFHVRRCGLQIQPVCGYHDLSTVGDDDPSLGGMNNDASGGPNHAAAMGSDGNRGMDEWYGYPQPGSISEVEQLEYTIDRGRYSSCECETSEEECLPTNVTLRTQAVAISRVMSLHRLKHSTERISVTEHISCGCKPRCKNRLCISPLKLIVHTFSDCACVCSPTDARCRQLLQGIGQFSPNEIPLPLNGSYILPPCQYGPMDDLHLYYRRCPQPIRRPVADED